jgi:hypothetical protein
MSWTLNASPELVRPDQRLDLGNHLHGAAVGQLGLDQALMGDEPELLQPLGLRTGPILLGELGVRVAPPQRQRLSQRR